VYLDPEPDRANGLPLFATDLVCVVPSRHPAVARAVADPPPLVPDRMPRAGEQYRFHFDMTRCIGCKCCVVACSEQNGNPSGIHWRRVGEVEGGHYPAVRRHHLSMGCNHCLEPSCLTGCPVEAYHKDPITGVVVHSADACIGCQYCTWNCSYGVPQYNPERGVVGKCDLCHNRLADGMAPACVSSCPENAIVVEIVNIEEWRQDYLSAEAPGLPSAGDSISTTRVTLPADLPPDTGRVDIERILPEQPHWPLVFMLVLTQLSAGVFAVLGALEFLDRAAVLGRTAVAALLLAAISLGTASLHLGRPIYAWRALKGLRRSWLSREVLSVAVFAVAAAAYCALVLLDWPGRTAAALATVLAGWTSVVCSARIYMVPARPAWATGHTPAEFAATGLLLGPLLLRAVEAGTLSVAADRWMVSATLAGAALQLTTQALKFLQLSRSDRFELRASALLLSGRLGKRFLLRLALLVAAGIALPLATGAGASVNFVLALAGEWLGRWLFFVSVVPKNMAAAFTRKDAA
jgi:DMSO reductase iron-sulfur subunit